MLAAQLSTGLGGNFLMQQFVEGSPGRQSVTESEPAAQLEVSTPHNTVTPRLHARFMLFM